MPARKIPIGNRAVTGMHGGTGARYESSLERDFFEMMMLEPDFQSVDYQPVTIQYIDSVGKQRKYTPDALVTFKKISGSNKLKKPILFEVKYREELKKDLANFIERFRHARQYAREQGWKFRIITERHIRTERFRSLSFLHPYKNRQVRPDLLDSILDFASKREEFTPNTISQELCTTFIENAEMIVGLWHLVAQGKLSLDLNNPITMNSTLMLTK